MARKSKEAMEKNRLACKEYYAKNTEACKGMVIVWRRANPDKVKEYRRADWRKRYAADAQRELARIAEWKKKNKGKLALQQSFKSILEKLAMIDAYGGRCACCSDDRFEFLTIDHINGMGNQERRRFGAELYRKLRLQGYPKAAYRLLCMNCNFAHGKYGYCPHEFEANQEYGLSAC